MSRIKSTYSNIFSGYILGKNRAISFVLNPLHNWAKGTSVSNYQAAGHLIRTTAADQQQLVAFDWAPVQWDEPLEHETVLVKFPLIVNKAELTLEETAPLGLRTEPFVNERYKLSYLGLP